MRRAGKEWIREQELPVSVIDFDAALRDPHDPPILDPRFAGPDDLHPNPAGLAAMADAVDPGILGGQRRD